MSSSSCATSWAAAGLLIAPMAALVTAAATCLPCLQASCTTMRMTSVSSEKKEPLSEQGMAAAAMGDRCQVDSGLSQNGYG